MYALDRHPTTSGYYYRGNQTDDLRVVFKVKPPSAGLTWQPSRAPYPNVGNYNISVETEAGLEDSEKDACFKLFYTGNLYKYCGQKLPTQTLFYYEACLMDVKNSKNTKHTKLSVSLFAFYCQKVLPVPSCRLYGFYEGFDACVEEPRSTIIVIVSVSFGVFLFIFVIIIILICEMKRRKKKSKEDRSGVPLRGFHGLDMYGNDHEENSMEDMCNRGEGSDQHAKENEGLSTEDGVNIGKKAVEKRIVEI